MIRKCLLSALILAGTASPSLAIDVYTVDFWNEYGYKSMPTVNSYGGAIGIKELKNIVNDRTLKIRNAQKFGDAGSYSGQTGLSATLTVDAKDLMEYEYYGVKVSPRYNPELIRQYGSSARPDEVKIFYKKNPYSNELQGSHTPMPLYCQTIIKWPQYNEIVQFYASFRLRPWEMRRENWIYASAEEKKVPTVAGHTIDDSVQIFHRSIPIGKNTSISSSEHLNRKNFLLAPSLPTYWSPIKNSYGPQYPFAAFKYVVHGERNYKVVVATPIGFYFSLDDGVTWKKGC